MSAGRENKEQSTGYGNSDVNPRTRTQRPSLDAELGRFGERVTLVVGDSSVRAFARKSGINDKSLRQYMAGSTDPSRSAMIGIANAGNVMIEWLATGEGSMLQEDDEEAKALAETGPLDTDLLITITEAVEYSVDQTGKPLTVSQKANMIGSIYDLYIGSDKPVDKAKVLRLVRAAA